MWSFTVFSVLCVAVATASAEMRRYDGEKVFQLTPQNERQLAFIASLTDSSQADFDFWTEPTNVGRPVEVRVSTNWTPKFTELLKSLQIPYHVSVDDVQKMLDSFGPRKAPKDGDVVGTFPTYQELIAWLEELCSKNPTMATCGEVGDSYEGRKIMYVKVGNPAKDAKCKIWIEGTIHAREWLSTATIVYILDLLVNKQATDATAKRMMDTYDWYVIPLSNPDGYAYSHRTDRMWRKTRSRTPNSFCRGADPNRNWDFFWNQSGGASPSECSDTYRGSAPFSEVETKAISDFVLDKAADSHVYFSIHSYAQFWLIPYGVKPAPSDYDELKRVADIGAKALMAVNSKFWRAGTTVDLLYKATGVSIDWAKAKAGITYSYCLELRPARGSIGGFVVNEREIVPSGNEVWAGLVAAVDAIPSTR